MNKQQKFIEKYTNAYFTVIADPKDYHCDFKIYKIFMLDEDDLASYQDNDDNIVTNLENVTPYLHGFIKWDGCSNWHFDEQEEAMIHFCSKEQAQDIGKLFGKMYNTAKQLIPHWSD